MYQCKNWGIQYLIPVHGSEIPVHLRKLHWQIEVICTIKQIQHNLNHTYFKTTKHCLRT